MKKFLFIAFLSIFALSCQKDQTANWKLLDLMEDGFPIAVMAPDSAVVSVSGNLGFLQDITIDSPEDKYHVQIYASDATTDDIAVVKAELVSDVRSNPFFSRIVEEEEAGFLYETTIDSTNYYSFRYVFVQGNQEYIFQTGISETFNEEEAKRLLTAVKQK